MKKRLLLLAFLLAVGISLYFAIQKAQIPSEDHSTGQVSEAQLKDLECQNNLREVRHAIAAYMADHKNNLPPSLKDLSPYGITQERLKCPVGGEPYLYSEGTVVCPHPGHEKY